MHFMYFSQRIRARLIVNKALNKCCINKHLTRHIKLDTRNQAHVTWHTQPGTLNQAT